MSSNNNSMSVNSTSSTSTPWSHSYNNSWTQSSSTTDYIKQYSDHCSSRVDHSRNGYCIAASSSATIYQGRVSFNAYA